MPGALAPEQRSRAVRRGEHLAQVRRLAAARRGRRRQALRGVPDRPQAAVGVESGVQELDAPQRQHCTRGYVGVRRRCGFGGS